MNEIYFIDTSFIIALSSQKDENHNKALELSKIIKSKRIKLVTSEFIIIELCNSFSKANLKLNAIAIVDSINGYKNIEVIKLSEKYLALGMDLYRKSLDKNWSLIDCISFEISSEKRIEQILTADKHFIQAGFRILM
jgi:uncharacterized protein